MNFSNRNKNIFYHNYKDSVRICLRITPCTLGKAKTKHAKHEERQTCEAKQPPPAKCGHHKYCQQCFGTCTNRPEEAQECGGPGAMLLRREFREHCECLRGTSNTKSH